MRYIHLDSNETVFFNRQLEHIMAQTYDVLYPELQYARLFPVTNVAGPGANEYTYRQYDRVGKMKLIADYGDDLPRSDVKGKEFTSKIRSYGGSYGYSIQEIRAALMNNTPLQQMKANAARAAWEELCNRTAFFADGSDDFGGTFGLFYNASIPKNDAPNGDWPNATPDEIIADIAFAINTPMTSTLKTEIVDTVLLPTELYALIASIPRSSTSDTTILEFVRRVHPGVTFISCNECAGLDPIPSGAAGPGDVMVAYRRSPDKLQFHIPQPFEQFAPQERGLEIVVPTHGRIGSLTTYYPYSLHIVEGIESQS